MMNTDCLGIHDVILFYDKYKLIIVFSKRKFSLVYLHKLLTLNITLIVYN